MNYVAQASRKDITAKLGSFTEVRGAEYLLYNGSSPAGRMGIVRDFFVQKEIVLCQRSYSPANLDAIFEMALVGGSYEDSNGLLVRQIQTANLNDLIPTGNYPVDIKIPKRWERRLLEIFIEVAYEEGNQWVGVIKAEDHDCYEEAAGITEEDLPEHQRRMRMRYNITPRRIRFRGKRFVFDEESEFPILRF